MPNPLTARETEEINAANRSGRRPVVFVHGLWLLPSSWDPWRRMFEDAGYATVAPGWPDDPETIEDARRDPSVFAGKSVQQVTDHFADAIGQLAVTPAIVGHSFGGLIAQKLAGHGLSDATVAIDPAPFRGVLPVPASAIKSSMAVTRNPLNRGRAITLTFDQFRYGWANTLDEQQARRLYDSYHVAGPGAPIFQAIAANVNPFSETKVDTANPDRGPLLVVSGEHDHTVPHVLAYAAYKHQRKNPGVTEFTEFPNRGHALIIDAGWKEVATTSLNFVATHAPAGLGARDPSSELSSG